MKTNATSPLAILPRSPFIWRRCLGAVASAVFLLAAAAQVSADGTNYNDGDLLLVFRKDGAANDVLLNLGTVSNYLGLANGTTRSVTNFDLSLVTSAFGADLTGVKYILMAGTSVSDPILRVWLSDANAAGFATDETFSRWAGQRSKIAAVGGSLNSYPTTPTNSLVLPPSDPGSYTYIVGSAGTLDLSTFGGSTTFTVEQDVPVRLRLFELKVSGANPKPASVQVGGFTVAANGQVTFSAGMLAPGIAVQPAAHSAECASTTTFTVTASGDEPFHYQWFAGAAPVGVDSATLSIGPVSFANVATYTVVVTNLGGSVTSSGALLTVTDTTPPVLSLPAPVVVTVPGDVAATNVSFSGSAADSCDGSLAVSCVPASGSSFSVGVTTVNCTATDSHGNTGNGSFLVAVEAQFTYQDTDLLLVFRKDGFNDVIFNLGTVSNYLGLTSGSPLNVTNWDLNLVTTNFGGSLSGVKYILMAATPISDPLLRVWLSDASSVDVPTDETYSKWSGQRGLINAVGVGATSHYSTTARSAILAPTDPGSYTYIVGNGGTLDLGTFGGSVSFLVEQDPGAGSRLFELKVNNAKPAATEVGGYNLTLAGQLRFTAGFLPPAIFAQPSNVSVECGTSASFTVGATGDTLQYQWYAGLTPVGANNATLTLNPVSLASAGSYKVVASNSGGSVTSSVAVLTVTDTIAPVIGSIAATENQAGVGTVSVLNCASNSLPGTVNIAVQASDTCGLAGSPTVGITNGVNGVTAAFVNESPAGTFNYTWTVTGATPGGTWNATVLAADAAGNRTTSVFTLCVAGSLYTLTGVVELQNFTGTNRDVTFVATGGAPFGTNTLQTNTLTLTFLPNGAVTPKYASFTLSVPVNTTNISAKTDWSLRRRLPVSFVGGQGYVSFTATNATKWLLAGDIVHGTSDNKVNTPDFTTFKSFNGKTVSTTPAAAQADLTGDGKVNTTDFTTFKSNNGKTGDPQ